MVGASVPVGWVAMARENDLRPEFRSANNGVIEIADLKPQEHAISWCEFWIADRAVMVSHVPVVQLEKQSAR